MKKIGAAILTLALATVCRAESRSIVLEVTRGTNGIPIVAIHSDVKSEQKKAVSVAEAATVLKEAKDFGSAVCVVMILRDIYLKQCEPLMKAISENGSLDLIDVRIPKMKTRADQILRNYHVEQTSGGDSSTRADAGLEPPQK